MISLTQESADILTHYMSQESPAPNFVRFGVKAGGCSGFTYTIDFDSRPRKFDLEFESFGVPLLVDKKSHLFIKETTIGWSSELQDKGFKLDNPHAKGSCGCRTSFQIDIPVMSENKPEWMEQAGL